MDLERQQISMPGDDPLRPPFDGGRENLVIVRVPNDPRYLGRHHDDREGFELGAGGPSHLRRESELAFQKLFEFG